MNRLNNILQELKRRNVFRVAMVYAVAGWLLLQLSTQLEGSLNLPSWFDTFVTVMTMIGFPIALILAWAFELTSDGVKPMLKAPESDEANPQTARRLIYAVMIALGLSLAVLGWQNFVPERSAQTQIESNSVQNSDISQSIAVLPFDDFSSGKDQDYFANGISEELLNVLSRINGLRVSSRTSAFSLKSQGKSIAEIGQALNVSYVLEGSVRKSGQTLRITAQLIETTTDQHLWSDTYDRPLTAENIFAVQDEITAAIVRELKGKLVTETPSIRTASLEAYDLYFRAREQVRTRHPNSLRAAVEEYKKVIAIDPGFAPAYSGLADAYLLMDTYAGMDAKEAVQLAAPIIDKARALEPTSAEALSSASLLALTQQDVERAIGYANQAIAANPNHAEAYLRLGGALQRKLQSEAALEAFQKGRALDPLSPVLLNNIVSVLSDLGQIEAAKETATDNIRWNPSKPFGYLNLAKLSMISTDYSKAHSLLKDAEALNPEGDEAKNSLSDIYLLMGMSDEAMEVAVLPVQKAVILAYNRQEIAARELISEHTAPFDEIVVHYYLRDFAKVLSRIRSIEPTQTGPLNELVPGLIYWYTVVTYFYYQEGDPDTPERIAKLDDYFGTTGPEDFANEDDLLAGAVYQIIKNDPSTAYLWIDQILDRGIVNKILYEPPFDGLRETPEFKLRHARMEDISAPHRDAIKAQLVNPKARWIEPVSYTNQKQ